MLDDGLRVARTRMNASRSCSFVRPARAGRATAGLVSVGKRGGHLDVNRLRLRYYAAQESAGIAPRRTLHQLRHTFATVLASHGVPLRTIQGWCGHEDHSTTERYAHFMPRHEDAALVSAAFAPTPAPTAKPSPDPEWWRRSARASTLGRSRSGGR